MRFQPSAGGEGAIEIIGAALESKTLTIPMATDIVSGDIADFIAACGEVER